MTPAITLEQSLSDDPWTVEIDPGDFEDSIINLVLNARDAMPDGGTLVIETANKVIDDDYVGQKPRAFSAGEFVLVSVSDNGVGMTPETIQKAVEPFFTTKEVGKGTGLGLSMVYGFLPTLWRPPENLFRTRRWGRRFISISREFKVLQNRWVSDPSKRDAVPGGKETILVVDDEKALVEITASALEANGYRTVAATNGREALEILTRDPSIDLLVSDVIMPGGMNGYALAAAALKQRPDLKILLMSGFTRKREQLANGDESIAAELAERLLHQAFLYRRIGKGGAGDPRRITTRSSFFDPVGSIVPRSF